MLDARLLLDLGLGLYSCAAQGEPTITAKGDPEGEGRGG